MATPALGPLHLLFPPARNTLPLGCPPTPFRSPSPCQTTCCPLSLPPKRSGRTLPLHSSVSFCEAVSPAASPPWRPRDHSLLFTHHRTRASQQSRHFQTPQGDAKLREFCLSFQFAPCQMTRVPRHPLQRRRRRAWVPLLGTRCSPGRTVPRSLLASSNSIHQGPSIKGNWGFPLLPRGRPQQRETSAESRLFPSTLVQSSRSTHTGAKLICKSAPVAGSEAWVCEER